MGLTVEGEVVYFRDFLKVLIRRWYVIVAGVTLVAAAAVSVMMVVPTNYEASGTVLILLPPAGTTDKPTNPYLNTPQGLTMAALIIGGVISTPEEQRSVFNAGFTSSYAVGQSPGTGVPLLYVTVEDTDPAMAVSTLNAVIRRIDVQLDEMQTDAGAPATQRMIAYKFSVTPQAEAVSGAKLRALAAVAGVGGVLTLLAAFSLDRWRGTASKKGRRRSPSRSTRDVASNMNESLDADPRTLESEPRSLDEADLEGMSLDEGSSRALRASSLRS